MHHEHGNWFYAPEKNKQTKIPSMWKTPFHPWQSENSSSGYKDHQPVSLLSSVNHQHNAFLSLPAPPMWPRSLQQFPPSTLIPHHWPNNGIICKTGPPGEWQTRTVVRGIYLPLQKVCKSASGTSVIQTPGSTLGKDYKSRNFLKFKFNFINV